MPSITPMMSTIFFDDALIEPHRIHRLGDDRAPESRLRGCRLRNSLACLALSAFGLTVLESPPLWTPSFQACRLLLGPLRQVGRAGGNFGGGVRHFVGRRLDLADGRADPLRHLVGVVLELPELALILGGDARRQIALGERAEHADEVLQRLAGVLAQRVHRRGEIEHEPFLALERNALGEVAGDRGLDEVVDLALDRLLDRLVAAIPRRCRHACRAGR